MHPTCVYVFLFLFFLFLFFIVVVASGIDPLQLDIQALKSKRRFSLLGGYNI